jgi:hypothetical protein
MKFWLNILKFNLEETFRFPPHLHPLPPGGEERKEKDEILTPLDTEGEKGRKFEDGTLTASKNEASG